MRTNSSSCMLLPSSLQIRGGPVGKGGHNSDEALVAAGSYQVTRRPTRPPLDEQSGDEPPGTDRSRQRHQRSVAWQVRPQAGPPPARIFTVAWIPAVSASPLLFTNAAAGPARIARRRAPPRPERARRGRPGSSSLA